MPHASAWRGWFALGALCALASAGCSSTPSTASDSPDGWISPPPVLALETCDPGDRAYCHWVGACNDAGTGCDCDDTAHYSPTDQCSAWHQAVVPDGLACLPGDRSFCHWAGACDEAGSGCECDDPDHYDAADQCDGWQAAVVPDGSTCLPGDRSFCNYRGACDAGGEACACDDPVHYTPDDSCAAWQPAIVPTGSLCVPGDAATCSYNGTCAPDGMSCDCHGDWWNGDTCAVPADSCPGYGTQPAPIYWSSDVCSGQGECVAPDTCVCDAGYGGEACSEDTCALTPDAPGCCEDEVFSEDFESGVGDAESNAGGVFVVDQGRLAVSGSQDNTGVILPLAGLVDGETYTLSFDLDFGTTGGYLYVTTVRRVGFSYLNTDHDFVDGANTLSFVAGSESYLIVAYFGDPDPEPSVFYLDNVRVCGADACALAPDAPGCCENEVLSEDFESGAGDAESNSGGTFVADQGRLSVSGTENNDGVILPLTGLVDGETYTLGFDLDFGTTGGYLYVITVQRVGGGYQNTDHDFVDGANTLSFVAGSESYLIVAYFGDPDPEPSLFYLDNVQVCDGSP